MDPTPAQTFHAPLAPPLPSGEDPETLRDLVEAFLAGRSAATALAYRADLADFQRFSGTRSPAAAATALLAHGKAAGHALALAYRADLLGRGLAPATLNRRLAMLRSLGRFACTLGQVEWALAVDGVRSAPYRETRGPERGGVARLLELVAATPGTSAVRDLALLRLLFDLALRRAEVTGLDVADVDLSTGRLALCGKGCREKHPLTLPPRTRAALAAWLTVRGSGLVHGPMHGPGAGDDPLFVNFDRAHKGRRLTGTSVYRIVRAWGRLAGLTVRPHGLRHAAITTALDLTGGDVRAVQRFSRHRDLRVLTCYDDHRRDDAGRVAALVSAIANNGAASDAPPYTSDAPGSP